MVDPFAQFRAAEQREAVYPVLGNAGALRVAAAWRLSGATWTIPPMPEAAPSTLAEAWNWLWEGSEVDVDALARAASVQPRDCELFLRILIQNRLIYPDCSLASDLVSVLAREVSGALLPGGL